MFDKNQETVNNSVYTSLKKSLQQDQTHSWVLKQHLNTNILKDH